MIRVNKRFAQGKQYITLSKGTDTLASIHDGRRVIIHLLDGNKHVDIINNFLKLNHFPSMTVAAMMHNLKQNRDEQ